MANLVVLAICLVAGFVLRRVGKLDPAAPRALNAVVVWVALPAMVLDAVPPLARPGALGPAALVPVTMAWISFAFAFVVVGGLGRVRGWDRATTGALVLTVGFGNTAFVGYPVLETLLGQAALPLAVLADQPGTFVAVSTLGLVTASTYGGGRVSLGAVARRVVGFPPFVALVVALVWGAAGAPAAPALRPALAKLASPLAPLALLAVGAQLGGLAQLGAAPFRRRLPLLAFGLGLRLVALPLGFALAYVGAFGMTSPAVRITVLQAAMAPMITSAVLVADFGLDEELAGLMIAVGVPLSLVTVPLWNAVLGALGVAAP